MDRFNRSTKKKHSFADDDDSYDMQSSRLPANPPPPAPGSLHLMTMQPLGRPPRDEEEKRLVFVQLIRLKENRKTHAECAELLGVSERSIRNYMTEPLYTELEQELRQEAKARGHLLISETIHEAIGKLHTLMHTAKSEFVQYKSAEYLLKVAGFEMPTEERERDNQGEVIEFLEKAARRGGTVNVQINNNNSTTRYPASGEQEEGYVLPEGATGRKESVVSHVPSEYMRPLLPGGRMPPPEEE